MATEKNTQWDVVVIGGGPAGMMSAGTAGLRGRSVLLLEKNPTLGKKLLLTGWGRCNFTNNKKDIRVLVSQYKGSGKFLMSAFSQFDVEKTIEFFNKRGVKTKEEAEGRVFPVSNKAETILEALIKYMKDGGVKIKTNAMVQSITFDKKNESIVIRLKNGESFTAKSCVLATGGASYPETGSTGEGFAWLEKLGHKIIKNDFALVPVAIHDDWVKKLSGLTLSDIKLTVFQDGKKQYTQKGKLLFTHFGISGPTVLNMSKDIGNLLRYGRVDIALDLFPVSDHGALKEKLQKILTTESNKKIKNSLVAFIPQSLVPAVLAITEIDGETACRDIRREDRKKIIDCAKAMPMSVKGLLGAEKAIVSSGGVDIREVDSKTMRSRIVSQIYLIGDVLDINRPSGGYSLQLCWTTGFVAGQNA